MTARLGFLLLVTTTFVRALDLYQQCFQCFFIHRDDFYFCQSSQECLPSDWEGCLAENRVTT